MSVNLDFQRTFQYFQALYSVVRISSQLFHYSIYEFLKFLFLATLGDIITAIKGNYDSPERDRAIKRDLWTVAKSIIAFIIACILF